MKNKEEDEKDTIALVFEAPSNSREKDEWAKDMVRIQIALWVENGIACAYCGKPYTSVDEFIARHPRKGLGMDHAVDEACWETYVNAI